MTFERVRGLEFRAGAARTARTRRTGRVKGRGRSDFLHAAPHPGAGRPGRTRNIAPPPTPHPPPAPPWRWPGRREACGNARREWAARRRDSLEREFISGPALVEEGWNQGNQRVPNRRLLRAPLVRRCVPHFSLSCTRAASVWSSRRLLRASVPCVRGGFLPGHRSFLLPFEARFIYDLL